MSWIEKLYKTYEHNTSSIGSGEIPLLPVCHSTQNAQVTIVIDGYGNFLRASVVPKTEARTIIPATEESAGRTSGVVAHPLCDKLQYVAADYVRFGGEKEPGHTKYLSLLKEWVESCNPPLKLRAILNYVCKGHVVTDLVNTKVLHCKTPEDGRDDRKLLNKWDVDKDAPEIFRLLGGGVDSKGKNKPWQADAFIRWIVEEPGKPDAAVWDDQLLWQSWQVYYGGRKPLKGLCLVTGSNVSLADQHPAKIRNDGDKAKLISSNDTSGFTFRGRFTSADEACGVGFEVTQKAHSALRWLIARQGRRDGDQAICAWAVSGVDVPDPLADTLAMLFKGQQENVSQETEYTAQEIGVALSKLAAGYSAKLSSTEEVVVMGLDSATPGRMAISFYRELTGSEFLDRVMAWHQGCTWRQNFGKDKVFVGAPSPRDIAESAYGRRLDDKHRKATVERLLPCIIDGMPIPRDLVESCVRRASNRQGLEHWEWEKLLGIACALFNQHHKERKYAMALERDRTTRDYLYGRLLALAEHLEHRALYVAGENRETNAAKLMQRFAERPHSTWLTIETSLTPYKVRLRSKRSGFLHVTETEMDEVVNLFKTDDFISDHRLTGEFLLGYHCQRATLQAKPESNDSTESENSVSRN
jgi:CRISPR-associated protein Csd1